MINLAPYSTIKTALLVRIDVQQYKTGPSATPMHATMTYSDLTNPLYITINGTEELYLGTGSVIDISSSVSEIRSTSNEVTITLSAVTKTTIDVFLNSSIKGSRISVFRVIIDPITHQPLSIAGNPMGRFFGIINNFAFDEQWGTDVTSNTISLICKSDIDVLSTSVNGRRTNSADQKIYFPLDVAMDRVPSLTGANYNFGTLT
jgi:hypothetical protein